MNFEDKKLYTAKAEIIKSLAHPTRLWIVDYLSQGEKCVCEIVENLDVDTSTISKHLLLLRKAGIIEGEKRGKWVYYSLKVSCVLSFSECVNSILQQQIQENISLLQKNEA